MINKKNCQSKSLKIVNKQDKSLICVKLVFGVNSKLR